MDLSKSHLDCEYRSHGVEIFFNDVQGQISLAEMKPLHRLAEVRRTRSDGDDAAVVYIFASLELY